jgi:hypothetical protein
VILHTKTCDYNSSRRFVIAYDLISTKFTQSYHVRKNQAGILTVSPRCLPMPRTLDSRTFYRDPIYLAGLLFTRMQGAIEIIVDLHLCILAAVVFSDSRKNMGFRAKQA